MYHALRPLLFCCQPETAHTITLKALKLLYSAKLLPGKTFYKPVKAFGLEFPNPVGLAAGLDKDAQYIDALAKLGFGFIEIGTVTPKPQAGNPKPRLFRLPKAQAIVNRMGFNGCGLTQFITNLQQSNYTGILGINIGKNKATPNEQAWNDYQQGMQAVYPYASYITINISSPNTPGLRELQGDQYLNELLKSIKLEQAVLAKQHAKKVPIIIKVAPDLTPQEIKAMSAAFLKHQIDGVIAANTSFSRKGVEHLPHGTELGGLSGAPINDSNTHVVKQFVSRLQGKIPVIALGGIMDVTAAQGKIDAGATLIQLYTGLIYHGPTLIKDICNAI